ncbi:uncharacterized protein LOC142821515 isoform X2 [Pelodiscus sinensis]|uniref:uncharacterized protein LOC142821515 isoform X2 n=1 Tax=Pelodiscus sinensis TaxID=13735 RepID=UPI003F6C407C
MEANKILEWWTETQKVQQQQQMQALQQLLNQLQERQEQMARGAPVTVPGAVAGSGGGEGVGTQLPIRLTKLGPEDDPEAFLVTFERVAAAAKWPPEHWATLLAPYLSGPAQLAYRGMSASDALCYYKVKEAILDQLGVTPETHRRRFREARYDSRERPRAVAQRVKEAGMRWLEPETKTGAQVADLVILEQYVSILPAEGQRWVRQHLPETLDEAVTLMEHYLAAEGPEGKGAAGAPREPRRSEAGTGKPTGAQRAGESAGSSLGPLPTRRLAPRWNRPIGEARGDRATETRPGTPPPEGAPKVVCYQCGQEGHYKRDCTLMDCTFGQRRAGSSDRKAAGAAQVLQIRKLRTSVYHPQTDGLVERFNRTLKGMLRKFAQDEPREWDKLLPALMFAVREKWHPREALLIDPRDTDIELGPWGEPEVRIEGIRVGEELPGPKREQLHHLLDQFRTVLTSRPGQTSLVQHKIETEPGRVVRDNMRPLPRKLWGTVKEELQAMLEWGVIQESRSEWRSPIVLVPKTDGSTRFCIDFRKVNAISRFDAYPMPRIDELLGRLGRAAYLLTLDLTKGYWQIPLSPEAQAKTAFATPFGLYQFKNMPFGLHGAAATFQRLMNQVLRDHQDYAAAYIDDIVIFSESWEKHLEHVTSVLRALREAGLTANPKKCQFGRAEVSYLGYTVGRGKLKPLVDKVQAVREHPTPTTKRKVRQFLGLAGYYRRFIPNFSSVAAPLTDLTRKGQPERVRWTAACDDAFQELKDRLVRAPVLAQPDFNKPFTLQTDASEVGLGAVLTQEEEGQEHPILYLSRKLFPREKGYATIEKEALALKWAVDSLRYFLLGDEFTVVTDHAPLQWMQQMKDTNPRILRWYLSLQPYKFRVVHRPGSANGNADWLSRSAENTETRTASMAPDLRGKVCGGVAPPLPETAGTPRPRGKDSPPVGERIPARPPRTGGPAHRPGSEPGPADSAGTGAPAHRPGDEPGPAGSAGRGRGRADAIETSQGGRPWEGPEADEGGDVICLRPAGSSKGRRGPAKGGNAEETHPPPRAGERSVLLEALGRPRGRAQVSLWDLGGRSSPGRGRGP